MARERGAVASMLLLRCRSCRSSGGGSLLLLQHLLLLLHCRCGGGGGHRGLPRLLVADARVVVVHGHGKRPLCGILPDDVRVEGRHELRRRGKRRVGVPERRERRRAALRPGPHRRPPSAAAPKGRGCSAVELVLRRRR